MHVKPIKQFASSFKYLLTVTISTPIFTTKYVVVSWVFNCVCILGRRVNDHGSSNCVLARGIGVRFNGFVDVSFDFNFLASTCTTIDISGIFLLRTLSGDALFVQTLYKPLSVSWFVSEVRNGAGNKNGCQPGGSFPSSCGMRALRGTDCFAGATAGFTAKPQMVAWGCKHTCACSGRDKTSTEEQGSPPFVDAAGATGFQIYYHRDKLAEET